VPARRVFAIVLCLVATAAVASCGGSTPADGGDARLPTRLDGGDDAPVEAALEGAAPVDAQPPVDASVPPCDLTKPFDAPIAVTELNTVDEDILSDVSRDGLTAYVASNHGVTGVHVFFATRPSTTAPFGARQLLFPNGSFDDWGVSLTTDGLTAILSSDRNGMDSQLYVASRGSTLAAFGGPALVNGTNSTANEEGPRWSADSKTLYFDSTRSGNRDLFRASVVGATFAAPVAITELNSPALEAVPVLSADELTIYFLSQRAPSTDGDIFVATRATTAAPFANIQKLANVNSAALDAPGGLSPDGCTLYMSSNRGGKSDVYIAQRPK
jgi:hypothetical protein